MHDVRACESICYLHIIYRYIHTYIHRYRYICISIYSSLYAYILYTLAHKHQPLCGIVEGGEPCLQAARRLWGKAVCVRACVCTYIHAHLSIYVYECIYNLAHTLNIFFHMYVCMYAYIYIYIHTYIHIPIFLLGENFINTGVTKPMNGSIQAPCFKTII